MKRHQFWAFLSLALIGFGSAFTCWEAYLYLISESDLAGSVMATLKMMVGILFVLSGIFFRGLAKARKS